jgi:N-acyl-L-homoserine lactone synthetase
MEAIMIKIISGNDHRHLQELSEMFRARAEVFGNRLGWDVTLCNGEERDRYDDLDPIYMLATHDGITAGSLRLLSTTGPIMMRDDFAGMFSEPIDISSPLIWECTRFCLHPWLSAKHRRGVSTELMLGICETALIAGIAQILGVYDRRMVKIYRRIGWEPEVLATGQSPTGPVFVGLWEVSKDAALSMRARKKILDSEFFSNNLELDEVCHGDL